MKVAFLDRDGVINREVNYLFRIEEFEYTENCVEGLKTLRELGYELIIVTNQAGIAKGYYTEEDYHKLTKWYLADLRNKGVDILDVYYCPHHPYGTVELYSKACNCRKPKPGMFFNALTKYDIDMGGSIMIGDKTSDIEAAIDFGIPYVNCFLVLSGHTTDRKSKFKVAENVADVALNIKK
jgi:D-glycero-D-manno-heptose 1,7-bisphosphate phosphatase